MMDTKCAREYNSKAGILTTTAQNAKNKTPNVALQIRSFYKEASATADAIQAERSRKLTQALRILLQVPCDPKHNR